MALSAPRNIFGIHSFTPYNPTTYLPYGIVKVLAGSSVSLSGELVKLNGGSNAYAWAVERGAMKAEISCKAKEYPDFLFELFLGKAPTSNAAETGGSLTALANQNGSTAFSATIGIASVLVIPSTGAANLKFGKFMVKAVSATTVDVFCLSDADFLRGSDGVYSNDALKIASAQSIATGAATNITAFGFKLTGGSGTIGMTTGDTAVFDIRPINTISMDVTVGVTGDTNPEFGAVVMAQKRANGEMMEIDLFRCVGVGLPLGFEEFKFSEAEIKIEAFYSSTKNGVFAIRHVSPSSIV